MLARSPHGLGKDRANIARDRSTPAGRRVGRGDARRDRPPDIGIRNEETGGCKKDFCSDIRRPLGRLTIHKT